MVCKISALKLCKIITGSLLNLVLENYAKLVGAQFILN
jgi:hypothetical protein